MGDIPRELLCLLIRERGISIINDSKNFQNFLTDYFKGDYKKERKCLTDSLLENIPGMLLNKKENLPYSTISHQLSQILINDLGITPELAKWTVDSWALALGVIQDPSAIEKSVITETGSEINQDYIITIDSNPSKSKIFLNGIQKGVTPLILKNLEFGRYHIQLIYEGYESLNQEFETRSNIDQKIVVTLMRKSVDSGSITIETFPSDAEIFLNSKRYGRSNKTIWNLSEGYYEVRLVLPGHRDIIKKLQVQLGDNVKIRESFVPEPEKIPVNTPGIITVDSSPSRAAVYLDDQFVGNTPLAAREIAPGNHSVSLRLSSYEEFRDQFHISPGEDRFIYKPLVKQKSSGMATTALVVCCAIGLIFLVLLFLPSSDTITAEGWNAKAAEYYNNGNYQDAVDAYNNAISYDKNNVHAWIYKGIALNQLGRYQEALDAFNKALLIDPNDNTIQIGRGIALENLKRVQGTQNSGDYSSNPGIPKYKRGDIVGGGSGQTSYYYAVGSYNSSSDTYLYYDLPEFLTFSSQDLTFTKIGNTSNSESRVQFEKENPYLFVTGRTDIPK